MTDKMVSPGRYLIQHPTAIMPPDVRAFQMWAVHPSDLDRFGMKREEFYLAHIEAAVLQAKEAGDV